jgi:hypothetical protein
MTRLEFIIDLMNLYLVLINYLYQKKVWFEFLSNGMDDVI